MIELTREQVDQVSGGQGFTGYGDINGYEAAGLIMAVVGFGSLFTPIGPITAGLALGSTSGLAIAQFWADAGS